MTHEYTISYCSLFQKLEYMVDPLLCILGGLRGFSLVAHHHAGGGGNQNVIFIVIRSLFHQHRSASRQLYHNTQLLELQTNKQTNFMENMVNYSLTPKFMSELKHNKLNLVSKLRNTNIQATHVCSSYTTRTQFGFH